MPKQSSSVRACVAALRKLDEAISKQFKPVPEGWFTIEDLATQRKVSRTRAADIALDMLRLNLVERQKWPFPPRGSMYIYRLV